MIRLERASSVELSHPAVVFLRAREFSSFSFACTRADRSIASLRACEGAGGRWLPSPRRECLSLGVLAAPDDLLNPSPMLCSVKWSRWPGLGQRQNRILRTA